MLDDPAAVAPAPSEAPLGEAGVLKAADRDLLAAAIRAGMAPEPPSPGAMVKSVLFVLAVGALLMAVYQGLQRWRPTTPLTLTADQTVTSRQITFGGGSSPVDWRVSSANIGSLQVTGPESDTVEIDLPLPASACAQAATELGPSARCATPQSGTGPVMMVPSPLSVDWASATPVQLLPQPGAGMQRSPVLGVTVTSPGVGMTTTGNAKSASTQNAPPVNQQSSGAGTGSAITFVADKGSNQQRWCFENPLSANKVQLQRGANQSVHAFTGSEADIVCGAGLRLIVGSPGPARQPPAVTLQDVASLRLEAKSTQQDAQSVVGQLHLGASGSTILGSPTELIVRAKPSNALDAVLFQQAGRSTLTLRSQAATSVLTDNGDLVTSIWDRYQNLTLPLFLAIAGGLVPLLLATMQGITSLHRARHARSTARRST